MSEKYDAIIIGAGMSGLAAGIRLAMFDKKVVILEKHTIPGGLNSYYQRRNETLGGVRQFDVGLHALTNFVKKGTRNKPFTKLLKQLRIPYDEFKLHEQTYSQINFPEFQLNFSNDFEMLTSEVADKFPNHIDEFLKLTNHVNEFDELNLDLGYSSSRSVLKQFISNDYLVEMLLCPLLIYGSAWENDMDFPQFVVMFKSIYGEGFARPSGGVRTIIDLLTDKLKSVGGEVKYRHAVESIITENKKATGVVLKDGTKLMANQIFSSMGLPETYSAVAEKEVDDSSVGKMSFTESIMVYDKKISNSKQDATIIFYNDSAKYDYQQSKDLYDSRSGVICFPDNYERGNTEGEGVARVTFMANYQKWKDLEKAEYKSNKELVLNDSKNLVEKFIPDLNANIRFSDVFTPTTVEKYTWHKQGTVYGATEKSRNGKTDFENLFVIGTDQGFLGIIGAMLSGISISNLYGLMESK